MVLNKGADLIGTIVVKWIASVDFSVHVVSSLSFGKVMRIEGNK